MTAEQEQMILRLYHEEMPTVQIALVVTLTIGDVNRVINGMPNLQQNEPPYEPTRKEILAVAKELRKLRRAKLCKHKNTEQRRKERREKAIRNCFINPLF